MTTVAAKTSQTVANEIGLRLWPAIVVTLVTLVAVFGTTWLVPGTMVQFMGMMFGPIVGMVLFGIWWLGFSGRPHWIERLLGVSLLVAMPFAVQALAHPSILIGLFVYGAPSVMAAVTVWFAVTRHWAWLARRWGGAIALVGMWSFWTLVRLDGVDGAIVPELAWRWSPTREEEYLSSLPPALANVGAASASTSPLGAVPPPTVGDSQADAPPEGHGLDEEQPDQPAETPPRVAMEVGMHDWPEFRGPLRDSRVTGIQFETDWKEHSPRELWRRPIGPAWSSFAVVGPFAYTQEQRGDNEVVLCLDVASGKEVWAMADPGRFWEAMAGAGPRATPTFSSGQIFTLGANGIVNCFQATDGQRVWSRRLTEDASVAKPPAWGFASSPLVVDQAVMVYAGGGDQNGLIAYDRITGNILWKAGKGTHSYSSPQLVEIDQTRQVLMLTELGVTSHDPSTGTLLWEHDWPLPQMNRSIQPNLWQNHVFLGTGMGIGTRAISTRREADRWQIDELWTSTDIKPYYNDFVVLDEHAYGFDGNIFTCIDLKTGKRKWKKGRYGNGQVLLVADTKILLVVSESGEVVLLPADPAQHRELTRLTAVHGKTWNHPVIAQGKLFVRNAEEAVCYELPQVH